MPKSYVYPLTIFDRVVKFKTLADMNQVVYVLFNPKSSISLTDFDMVTNWMVNNEIPFYIEQNKSIPDYAWEYIEQIKPQYKHLGEKEYDLIFWGFNAGFKKCKELSELTVPDLSV